MMAQNTVREATTDLSLSIFYVIWSLGGVCIKMSCEYHFFSLYTFNRSTIFIINHMRY